MKTLFCKVQISNFYHILMYDYICLIYRNTSLRPHYKIISILWLCWTNFLTLLYDSLMTKMSLISAIPGNISNRVSVQLHRLLLDVTQSHVTGVWSATQNKLDLLSHNLQSQQIAISKPLQIQSILKACVPGRILFITQTSIRTDGECL